MQRGRVQRGEGVTRDNRARDWVVSMDDMAGGEAESQAGHVTRVLYVIEVLKS